MQLVDQVEVTEAETRHTAISVHNVIQFINSLPATTAARSDFGFSSQFDAQLSIFRRRLAKICSHLTVVKTVP
jgi:hypothetical protein